MSIPKTVEGPSVKYLKPRMCSDVVEKVYICALALISSSIYITTPYELFFPNVKGLNPMV